MINDIDNWLSEKNNIRNNILDSVEHLFELYSSNIDMCLRNDDNKGAFVWIKAIENLLNFIDGKRNE